MENKFGFIPTRLTTKAIYLIKRLIGFYRNRKNDLYRVLINLEIAQDKVPREGLSSCLERKGVLNAYV